MLMIKNNIIFSSSITEKEKARKKLINSFNSVYNMIMIYSASSSFSSRESILNLSKLLECHIDDVYDIVEEIEAAKFNKNESIRIFKFKIRERIIKLEKKIMEDKALILKERCYDKLEANEAAFYFEREKYGVNEFNPYSFSGFSKKVIRKNKAVINSDSFKKLSSFFTRNDILDIYDCIEQKKELEIKIVDLYDSRRCIEKNIKFLDYSEKEKQELFNCEYGNKQEAALIYKICREFLRDNRETDAALFYINIPK